MNDSARPGWFVWFVATAVVLSAASPSMATSTRHDSEEEFLAAAGGEVVREKFDGFDSGTTLTEVPGLHFSSPNSDSPVVVFIGEPTSSFPNALGGGIDPNGMASQILHIGLESSTGAFAFYLIQQSPEATAAVATIFYGDESSEMFSISNEGEEFQPVFFGVTSTVPIVAVRVTSGTSDGVFEEISVDDVMFDDEEPPVCLSEPVTDTPFRAVFGQADDNAGIASVVLDPNSENLSLEVNEAFDPGDTHVEFTLEDVDPNQPARGRAIVTDLGGNQCFVSAHLTDVAEGEVDDLVLCQGGGIVFQASGSSGGGSSACSGTAPQTDPNSPPFPPGYEPSPPDDPFPCQELTIESPIEGPTEMVYKKDGDFDARLRLLYSHLDPNGFTPYMDVTQSVEEIADVIPDPTRLKGGAIWSTVKVTCAILGDLEEFCSQPGAPANLDFDEDTYDLCPAVGEEGDCNDQIESIHPGATETCNGMDDDCDGLGDSEEGNPGGGGACTVEDEMGNCAMGVITCINANLICEPGEPEPETCDGQDEDCDGLMDEDYVFDGYLSPVNNDGSSIFNRKSTIPFRFRLTRCDGSVVVDAVAHISVFPFTDGIIGSEIEEILTPGRADTGTQYRSLGDGNYHFNLKTTNLVAGRTYLVRTTLDDGTEHTVLIGIR